MKKILLFFLFALPIVVVGCKKKQKEFCKKNLELSETEYFNALHDFGTNNSFIPLYARDTKSYVYVDEWVTISIETNDSEITISEKPRLRNKQTGEWESGSLSIWSVIIEKRESNNIVNCNYLYYSQDTDGEIVINREEAVKHIGFDVYCFSDDKIIKGSNDKIEVILDGINFPVTFERENVSFSDSNTIVIYSEYQLKYLLMTSDSYKKLYS